MISIIVPVYNVKDYLSPCVESILNSTYQDFELLLVDDGATDGSGDLCDRIAQSDQRVRVIHKPNGGLPDARNAGLREAKGECIMFIDGDDQIHPRMLEVLKTAIDSGDYDFSMVRGVKLKSEMIADYKKKSDESIQTAQQQVLSRTDCINGLCRINYQFHVVWNKLYRSSLIQGMQFAHTVGEDLEWNTRAFLRTNKAVLFDARLYYYIQRGDSIMHEGVNKNFVERIHVYEDCLNHVPADNRLYRAKFIKKLFSMMLYIRRKCNNTEFESLAKSACADAFKRNIKEFLHSDLSWSSKVRSIAGYYLPFLYNFETGKRERIFLEKSKQLNKS